MLRNALAGLVVVMLMLFGGQVAAGALAKFFGPETVMFAVLVPVAAVIVFLLR